MLKPGSRGGQEKSPSLSKCRPTVSSNRYPNGDGIGVREGGVHGRIKDTGDIAGRRSTDENEPRSVYGEDASVGSAKKDHHEEAAYLQNLCTKAMKLLNGQISQLEEEHTDYGRAVNMLLTDVKQLASELQERTDDINDNGDAGKTFEQKVITNLQQTMTALKEAGRDHKAKEILANKHAKLVTKELRRSNAAQDERSLKKYIEIMKGIVVNNSSKQQVREGNETSTKIPPTTTPGAAGAAAATINALKEIGKQVSDLVISHTNDDDGENNDDAAGGAGGTSGDLMNMVEKGVSSLFKRGTSFFSTDHQRAQLLSLFSTKARAQKIFLNRVRDTVIKFLLLKISSYPIPPIRGEMSGWKYSIYEIDLKEENLRIDPDDVAIVLTEDKTELRIRADPVHIKPTLKWNCTQLGFPYWTDSGNCAAHVERASVTITFKIHWILQHEHKKRYCQLLSRKKERKAAERRRRRKQFKPANTNIVKKKKEDKNDEDAAQDDDYSDCSNYIGAEEKRERLGEGGGKPKNLQAISKANTITMSQSDAIPSQHREEEEEGGDKRRRLDDATQTFNGNSNDKDKNDKKLHHSQILTADDANTTTTSMNITIVSDNATQEEKKKEKKRKEKRTYVETSDDAEEERNKGEHIERKVSEKNRRKRCVRERVVSDSDERHPSSLSSSLSSTPALSFIWMKIKEEKNVELKGLHLNILSAGSSISSWVYNKLAEWWREELREYIEDSLNKILRDYSHILEDICNEHVHQHMQNSLMMPTTSSLLLRSSTSFNRGLSTSSNCNGSSSNDHLPPPPLPPYSPREIRSFSAPVRRAGGGDGEEDI